MHTHVLMVARSGAFQETLAGHLRGRGFQVHAARTAGDVVRAVREIPLAAVLIESMRGAEAERFRGQIVRIRPECRVLFIDSLEHARASGVLDRHGADAFVLAQDDLGSLLADVGAAAREAKPAATSDHRLRSLVQTLDVVVSLLEADDPWLAGFSNRVAGLAADVAAAMGLEGDAIDEIVVASLVRDLGMAGIDRTALDQPRYLEAADMIRMQQHVDWTLRILEHIEFPWKVLAIIRHHHERYDGAGYPDASRGRQIPLAARIVAAAETWIAMTSDRPHRKAKDWYEARAELMAVAGSQLDPEVVEALLRVVEDRAAARGPAGPPRIVLRHADASYARLVRMRLIQEGFQVALVGDGETGGVVGEAPPSLILCEIGRPAEDARARLREAREASGSHRVPIAVLAETDDRVLRMACLQDGIDDFIPKDNDLEEITARVRNILVRESKRNDSGDDAPTEGIRGRLGAVGTADIAQFLMMGGKTACVSLDADEGVGTIWFENGRIAHAICPGLAGHDALRTMLRWTDGAFTIRHGVTTDARSFEDEGSSLIREVLLRADDESLAQRDVQEVPPGR